MTWIEFVAERRIQEALDDGELTPTEGAEISGLDQPYDPMWWVKGWIRREGLGHTVMEARGSGHEAGYRDGSQTRPRFRD